MVSRVLLDTRPMARVQGRLEQFTDAKLKKVRSRAVASTVRAIKPEAARAVAQLQLNLPPATLSKYISANQNGESFISVKASKKRLPLSHFKPQFSDQSGVSVTTWLDVPAYSMPHAFKLGGEAWQRIPGNGPSGLVGRFPIIKRVGPSLKRALERSGPSTNEHRRDQVVDRLAAFTQTKLNDEIRRLIASAARVR